MSETLARFNTAFAAALAPPATLIAPSPIRQTTAVAAVQCLEANWFSITEQVALIDFLSNNHTAADTYSALTEPDVHRELICVQLKKFGVHVFASPST